MTRFRWWMPVVLATLCAAGVNAILNFAPNVLRVPSNVVVSNVNLAIELENLSYFRSLAES